LKDIMVSATSLRTEKQAPSAAFFERPRRRKHPLPPGDRLDTTTLANRGIQPPQRTGLGKVHVKIEGWAGAERDGGEHFCYIPTQIYGGEVGKRPHATPAQYRGPYIRSRRRRLVWPSLDWLPGNTIVKRIDPRRRDTRGSIGHPFWREGAKRIRNLGTSVQGE